MSLHWVSILSLAAEEVVLLQEPYGDSRESNTQYALSISCHMLFSVLSKYWSTSLYYLPI
jgi:hypothetical protein